MASGSSPSVRYLPGVLGENTQDYELQDGDKIQNAKLSDDRGRI